VISFPQFEVTVKNKVEKPNFIFAQPLIAAIQAAFFVLSTNTIGCWGI
jgi:hypothetical protein